MWRLKKAVLQVTTINNKLANHKRIRCLPLRRFGEIQERRVLLDTLRSDGEP
jgi:hypothetical protein